MTYKPQIRKEIITGYQVNYSQQAKCGPKIISESQVWLEHSHALCLGTVCGCSHVI